MASTRASPNTQHVVIVGAGFGGLYAAKALSRDPAFRVTVIDKRNYHLFQPLLYQVATGKLAFRESVAEGLASAPDAFIGLLKGRNFGKQLVKLA